ncbi:MAG: murein biosynthesis integral membrane protein MurJ, partial [Firmicutes bacterium]|nr:murein biosynthesis integral membrane protein MurJ [Bacillota bacterium]
MFIATLISRATGFLREIVMAAFFGTSAANDAWLMASVLPNLLFSTVNGAISVTMVPLLTQADAQYSRRSTTNFLNEVFTSVILISLVLIVLGELFAHPIMQLIAPGFHGKTLALTVRMTRIMIPTIIFWGLSGLMIGILQEQEQFVYPALSPVAINITRVVTIIVLGHFWGIQGVAIGFLLAVLSQFIFIVPPLHRLGFHLHFRWHISHPLLKKMAKMAGPFFLTSSVGTAGVLVDRILASSLKVGSLAALNYSYTLVQLPVGLIVSSLTTPIYTRLSVQNSEQNIQSFKTLALSGWQAVLLVIAPLTIWMMALNIPILRLLYQHGAFTNHSTIMTGHTLFFFALGLPGFALS